MNCGKYTCTILFYMTLSLYRINESGYMMVIFVVFATINSIYVCKSAETTCFAAPNTDVRSAIWDLLMDWS